jgi:hypothetical protein
LWAVLGFDDPSQAFSCGDELVFEVGDAPLGGVGLDHAGIAFGDESTVEGFEVGDACGQVGSVRCFDLGTEVQAEALLEFVPLGAQRLDLISGDG